MEAEGTPSRNFDGGNYPDLGSENEGYFYFSVVNPKDSDGKTTFFLKHLPVVIWRSCRATSYADFGVNILRRPLGIEWILGTPVKSVDVRRKTLLTVLTAT